MRLADKEHMFGVFMPMAQGGWIISKNAPKVDGGFDLNKRVAMMADDYGFDFILSMMKWRGYGGETKHWDSSLESLILMSALSQVTRNVKIWGTCHTLLQNPAVVAKMMTTLDHASGGRAGLNIVSGAYAGEFEQMSAWRGDLSHDQRYVLAEEWIEVILKLWSEDRVDYDGKYYKMIDCMSDPKPLSQPRPDLICAGTSEVGLRYTAKYTDAGFVHGETEADIAIKSKRAKEIGAEYGKKLKTFAMYIVVPGATDAEAEARVANFAAGADQAAIANMVASYGIKPDGRESAFVARSRKGFMASVLAGSPKSLLQQIEHTVKYADLTGMMLIFPDYIQDLKIFGEEILPGLRKSLNMAPAA